jgi:ABC-type siderophore export system fused ATPase/permease subunit
MDFPFTRFGHLNLFLALVLLCIIICSHVYLSILAPPLFLVSVMYDLIYEPLPKSSLVKYGC